MGQLCSACFGSTPNEQQHQNPPIRAPPASGGAAQSTRPPTNNAYPAQQQPRNNNAAPAQSHQQPSRAPSKSPQFGGHREWPPASSAGDAARFQASVHAKKRGELAGQSQAAYQAGDKALAKKLSDQSKAEAAAMDRCNDEAEKLYFEGNNAKHDLHTIDLHGLYVSEAIERLEGRIKQCQAANMESLVVIVGRGNHSKDHIAKIRPRIEQLMRDHRLKVAVDRSAAREGTRLTLR